MPRNSAHLLLMLLASPVLLGAASPALTLGESVEMATRVQPDVQQAAIDTQTAAANLALAQSAGRPALSLEGGYLGTSTRTGELDFVANNAPNETRAQVVGRWTVFSGQLGLKVRQAEAEREAATWGLRAARLTLAGTVSDVYFGVLKAEATAASLRGAVAEAKRGRDAAALRFKTGVATRLDFSQAELQLATQEAALAGAEADVLATRARFQILTGAAPGFRLAEPGPLPPLTDVASPDLTTRPDLRQAQVLIQARQAELQAARAAGQPQLNLSSAAGWDTGGVPGLDNAGASVGFDVAWPFFTSGAIGAQAQMAELGSRRAKLELVRLTQQARMTMNDARAAYRRAETQLIALSRARELANRSLEMARFGFQEGSLPFLAVLTAQRAAIDARVAEQNARYDAALALAHLRLALGQTP